MTVIVGIDYFDEVLVIADTRVSRPDGTFYENVGLKKLLIFGNKNKVAVLGFAGRVSAAQAVVRHLMTNRLTPNYKRPFVIPCLKDDIGKWIQEVTTTLPSDQLRGLQFLLCALEPLRKRPLMVEGVQQFSSFSERHVYVYSVRRNGQVDIHERGPFAVIGSGRELSAQISENARDAVSFGRGIANFPLIRAALIGNITSILFRDIDSKTVGGPFEIVRIVVPPTPSQRWYQWLRLEEAHIEITHQDDKTTMRNVLTDETRVLLPLWSWPPESAL